MQEFEGVTIAGVITCLVKSTIESPLNGIGTGTGAGAGGAPVSEGKLNALLPIRQMAPQMKISTRIRFILITFNLN